MKVARILDQPGDTFALEYDNTLGKKNTMRLDAHTYDQAIHEAKSFLEIDANNQDAEGAVWDIE